MIEFLHDHWFISIAMAIGLGVLTSFLLGRYLLYKARSKDELWRYEERDRIDAINHRRSRDGRY